MKLSTTLPVESPKLRTIDFFMDNTYFDFTKKEVIEALGVSKQTFYKYFGDLEELGIVKVSRKIGRASLYKINMRHPLVTRVYEMITQASLKIAEEGKVQIISSIWSTTKRLQNKRNVARRLFEETSLLSLFLHERIYTILPYSYCVV